MATVNIPGDWVCRHLSFKVTQIPCCKVGLPHSIVIENAASDYIVPNRHFGQEDIKHAIQLPTNSGDRLISRQTMACYILNNMFRVAADTV
jgi:hypothetical protein